MSEIIGICHVCGLKKPLTKEHVPPQAALNKDTFYLGSFEQALDAGPGPVKEGPKYQGGIYFETLCRDCNNSYCNKYNPELISWINGGEYLLRRIYETGNESAKIWSDPLKANHPQSQLF